MSETPGGIDVVGLVMGMHVIADIQVAVPFRIMTHITAEQMHRSKDLWRDIQQKKIFQLTGRRSVAPNRPVMQATPDMTRIGELEKENRELRRQLASAEQRNQGLQDLLAGLQGQLAGFQKALGRIENLPGLAQPVVMQAVPQGFSAPVAAVSAPTEAVGGDAPLFIPSEITPKGAETNIKVASDTEKNSNVSSAASRLKELRRQQAGEG